VISQEGDALVVMPLNRPARSTLHRCQIAAEVQRKGVEFQALDQQIDTTCAPYHTPHDCTKWSR